MDPTHLDLAALGMSKNAEIVLRALVAADASTVRELSRRVGLEPTSVSRAVDQLVHAGIARRGAGRPTPVFLNPLDEAVNAIRARAHGEHQRREEALRRLMDEVGGLGSPVDLEGCFFAPFERVPCAYETAANKLARPQQRLSLSVGQVRVAHSFLPSRGRPLEVRVVLSTCLTHVPPMPGVDVRHYDGRLPDFAVFDAERAGLMLLVDGRMRVGWTTDDVHVAMLQKLFERLWVESTPSPAEPAAMIES